MSLRLLRDFTLPAAKAKPRQTDSSCCARPVVHRQPKYRGRAAFVRTRGRPSTPKFRETIPHVREGKADTARGQPDCAESDLPSRAAHGDSKDLPTGGHVRQN